jgi:hypothetical protein
MSRAATRESLRALITDLWTGLALDGIPWANWLGAILWVIPEYKDDQQHRHRRLLALAGSGAPRELTEAVTTFVTNELARGSHPHGLEGLSACLSPELGEGLCILAREIRASIGSRSEALVIPSDDAARGLAVQAWRTVSEIALQAAGSGAAEEVLDTIEITAGHPPSQLAIEASGVLMNAIPELAWPKIRDAAGTDPTTCIPLASTWSARG